MKPYSRLLLLIFLMAQMIGYSQPETQQPVSCGYDEVHEQLIATDQDYAKRIRNSTELYRERVLGNDQRNSSVVYTVPVVVHIIHNGSPLGTEANPTDDQVAATIATASQRFRHLHSGADTYSNPLYGVDTEIELCMAQLDPDGNYTTGVTRHYDPTNAIGTYNDVATALNNNYAWDNDLYCNLFIMTDMTNASGVYIGGFDFTIYTSGAFWSGLIAHEIGHYFNLRHTFNGGCTNTNCLTDGDGVCDTPPKAQSGFTEDPDNPNDPCNFPGDSCDTDDDDNTTQNPYRPGNMGNQPDMLANYMDYTGSCWDSFTEGQKARMRADIDNFRTNLTNNSTACNTQPLPANDAGITTLTSSQADACSETANVTITIKNHGGSMLSDLQVLVYLNDVLINQHNWAGSLASGAETNYLLPSAIILPPGDHDLHIETSQPNSASDANPFNDDAYATLSYLGGTSCAPFTGCANYNTATASGPGNSTIIDLTGTFPSPSSDALGVQICITTSGDVSSSSEVFNVYDENNALQGTTRSFDDCEGPGPTYCFITSLSDYNSWIADGTITVTLDPVGTAINPNLCISNEACAYVNVPQGNACPASLTLGTPIASGTYLAGNTITSNTILSANDIVTMSAGTSVCLTNGFEAVVNSDFLATIGGCSTAPTAAQNKAIKEKKVYQSLIKTLGNYFKNNTFTNLLHY